MSKFNIVRLYTTPSRRLLLLFLIVFVAFPAHAKCSKAISKYVLYRVYLVDKCGSAGTIYDPHTYLSEKSLLRRARQHLRVDSTDLPVSEVYQQNITQAGYNIVGKSKWNNTLLVKCSPRTSISALLTMKCVSQVKKVYESADSVTLGSRIPYRKTFHDWDSLAHNFYGMAYDQIKALNGVKLHEQGYKGKGMLIALLDGGYMNTDRIPALKGISIAGTRNFTVSSPTDIFQGTDHGTMVLSEMGTSQPGIYVGTAPEASYLLLRSEDTESESLAEEDYWAQAAEYADSVGADVVNSSLGYHAFDNSSTSHTYAELDGKQTLISHTASMMADKGMILVCSAGNDGMGTWKKINFPADALNIITVGAVSPNGLNAAFSSVGPTADGRIKPDIMAYGCPASVINGRGSIVNENGTSFAAPIVTGLVACLWQALPNCTARQIEQLVINSASHYNTPDNICGYGMPDFWKAYKLQKNNR